MFFCRITEVRAKRSNGVFEETSTVSSPTANEPQPRPDTDKYALLLSMRSTFTFIHLAGQSELQMWKMVVEHGEASFVYCAVFLWVH